VKFLELADAAGGLDGSTVKGLCCTGAVLTTEVPARVKHFRNAVFDVQNTFCRRLAAMYEMEHGCLSGSELEIKGFGVKPQLTVAACVDLDYVCVFNVALGAKPFNKGERPPVKHRFNARALSFLNKTVASRIVNGLSTLNAAVW
jgi:hypothetical protein